MRSTFQKQTQEKLLSVGILSEYKPTDFVSRFNSLLHELIHFGQHGLEPLILEVEFVVPWLGQVIGNTLKLSILSGINLMKIFSRIDLWVVVLFFGTLMLLL